MHEQGKENLWRLKLAITNYSTFQMDERSSEFAMAGEY